MPRIINEIDIKRQSSIAEVIGRRVPLKPARGGGHLEGSCPFHASKSGRSFHVDPARGSWYCFGCSEGGSLPDFLMKFEGCDYPGALEIMAAETGIAVEYGKTSEKDGCAPHASRQQVLQVLETACAHYCDNLAKNQQALDYLEKRGFGGDVVAKWRIGYAQVNRILSVGEETLLQAAGLARKNEKNGAAYDPLSGRITIPTCDHAGHVLGFTGRLMDAAQDRPKYLNTADTMVFKKGRALFGVRQARELLRRTGEHRLHVLEGQLKVIACQEAGLPAVAAGGTAFTPEQAALAVGLCERIAICPDPDQAGAKAVLANAPLLRAKGADVWVGELDIPDSIETPVKDPDDLRAMGIPVSYQYTSLVEWLYVKIRDMVAPEMAVREIQRTLLPLICSQPIPAVRWREMQELAILSGIPESEWRGPSPNGGNAPAPIPAAFAAPSVRLDTAMTPGRMMVASVLQAGKTGWEQSVPWQDLPSALVDLLSQASRIIRLASDCGISIADSIESVADGKALVYFRYWLSVDIGMQDIRDLAARVASVENRERAAAAGARSKYIYAGWLNRNGGK